MTIEQLSEKILALAAECKALTGSENIMTDGTNGPTVHMYAFRPNSLAAFMTIDAPMCVERHSDKHYKAYKMVGGVEYFILLEAQELGLMPQDVTAAVGRYLEAKQTKEAS